MKHCIRKTICLTAVLFLAGMAMPCVSAKTKAAEADTSTETTMARIVIPEEEVFSTASSIAATGYVVGDGVRLRKSPSSSGTILELMNNGERVNIFESSSTTNWYYVERIKTGTKGYASKKYITPYQ